MLLRLSKKDQLLLAAILLVCAAAVFIVYRSFYQPAHSALHEAKVELKSENQLLAALDKKSKMLGNDPFESASGLQQKLPVKPLTDQWLLHIEKAELMSNIKLVSIAFSQGQGEEVPIPETETEEEALEGETAGAGLKEAGEQTESVLIPRPEGVEALTASLSLQAENYAEMQEFLKKVEESQRLVMVDRILLTAPKERKPNEELESGLPFEIVISAFYRPDLIDLINSIPELNPPQPAHKQTPFPPYTEKEIK